MIEATCKARGSRMPEFGLSNQLSSTLQLFAQLTEVVFRSEGKIDYMPEHKFGGPWTEVKLEAVMYYLECYTKALSQQPFELWYIDAFAGSGSREVETVRGGIFEGRPITVDREVLAGSARRALRITPPFHRFVFIETDPSRHAALQILEQENTERGITVISGEANSELKRLVQTPPWTASAKLVRGVVFLDPYALQVEWSTLVALANTQKVDVWYLFPLRDVTRQLALRQSGIGPKAPMLDRVLGPEWRQLYSLPKPEEAKQLSWLETRDEPMRDVDQDGIEAWVQSRLEDIFPYASPPLPILTDRGRRIFSLFLAVSNPSKKAVDLAKHFQNYSFRQAGLKASRRKSAP